jgi:hypothetical protein
MKKNKRAAVKRREQGEAKSRWCDQIPAMGV